MNCSALTDGASWFLGKILFRSKYMNILTRSSIELVSPSFSSSGSRSTTWHFRFFVSGFHMAHSFLSLIMRKMPTKYIRTIFGNLFYGDPHRRRQPHISCQRAVFIIPQIKKEVKRALSPAKDMLLHIPYLTEGDFSARGLK